MNKPVLTFHYPNNITLTTKHKLFREAIQFVLDRKEPTNFTPLKMVVESTGKIFYFNEKKFKAFLNGEMLQKELLFETECNGLFRNKEDILINNHSIVDAGSLFMLRNQSFILIDDDWSVLLKAPDDNFVEV